MDLLHIITSLIALLAIIAVGIYLARLSRGKKVREAEVRRPEDKGKHVEL
jgi:VIT1/CCC1 family predicted Fe2+/Mn2+ transporter